MLQKLDFSFGYKPRNFILLIVVVWLVSSITTLVAWDGEHFPRTGAFLVAAMTMFLAVYPPVSPSDPYAIKMFHEITRRLNLADKNLALSIHHNALLAASLEQRFKDENKVPPLQVRRLASNYDQDFLSDAEDVRKSYDQKSAELIENHLAASENLVRANSFGARLIAACIAVGTLQWGFGDNLARVLH